MNANYRNTMTRDTKYDNQRNIHGNHDYIFFLSSTAHQIHVYVFTLGLNYANKIWM